MSNNAHVSVISKDIAEIIRRSRLYRHLSQNRLAGLVGTTQSVISRIEKGDASPSVSTLCRIAEVLNCKIDIKFIALDTKVTIQPGADVLDTREVVEF